MKTAHLIKTNPTGTRQPQDEVVLVVTHAEALVRANYTEHNSRPRRHRRE